MADLQCLPLQQQGVESHGESPVRCALVYLNNDKLVSRGVGYLIQVVRGAGYQLDFFDTVWLDKDWLDHTLVRGNYDVLLVSVTSFYWRRAAQLIDYVKQGSPKTITLVGGAHATVWARGMLLHHPSVDYLCVGEGEQFIVDFLDRMRQGQSVTDIENLGYRDEDGQPQINSIRPPTDLTTLPAFDYDNFHPKSVVRESEMIPGFTYVFATRGCPYRCTYCCNQCYLDIYGSSFLRTQKIDTVIEELRQLQRNYPVRLAYFGDEMILFDRPYVKELFTRIYEELRQPYGCMFRVDAIDDEVIELLYKTGCRYVATGVECGDEDFRQRYLNRRYTNKQLIEGVRKLRTIPDIFITTYNMKGWPVTYDEQLTRATVSLNNKLDPNHRQTTWFYPIPGTQMYDYCVERNLIDWEKYHNAEDYFRKSTTRSISQPKLDHTIYQRSGRRNYRPRPKQVIIVPNTVCNSHCRFCSHRLHDIRTCQWSYSDITEKLKTIWIEATMYNVGGCGEIVLSPWFDKMMNFLSDHQGKICFATNGYAINPKTLRQYRLDHITFSIHSLDPETYDSLTGTTGRLPRVLKNLEAMCVKPRKYGVDVAMVMTQRNISEAPGMARYILSIGVDHLRFLPLADPKVAMVGAYDDDLPLTDNPDNNRAIQEANEILSQGSHSTLTTVLSPKDRYQQVLENMHTCRAPWHQIVIGADGAVQPCCFIPPQPEFGNAFKQPWEDIWNSPEYNNFRRQVALDQCELCLRYCKNWG